MISKSSQICQKDEAQHVSLQNIFWTFFRIGLFTFGGGLAMLPVIRHELVFKRAWIRDEDFIGTMSMATIVPGVIAVNIAYLLGRRLRGKTGSVAAIFGTILPSFFVILFVAGILLPYFNIPKVAAFFRGCAIAVAGQLAFAGFTFGKRLLRQWQCFIVVGACVIVIGFLRIHPIWGLIMAAIMGYLICPEQKIQDQELPGRLP